MILLNVFYQKRLDRIIIADLFGRIIDIHSTSDTGELLCFGVRGYLNKSMVFVGAL